MKRNYLPIAIFLAFVISCACSPKPKSNARSSVGDEFAKEMVEFVPYEHNPLFSGTNSDTWDKHIRERGFILHEDGLYKMWYTGYSGGDDDPKSLGYATSEDGLKLTRYPHNPIFSRKWTEDMFVMKYGNEYYMYAEGKNDIAHMLTSPDGINWEDKGDLVIISSKGDTIPGPYGTPSVLIENGKWYLFYERNDEAIWLATSTDKITWINVQDEPVLEKGPGNYDSGAVAANQIIRYNGKYYMFYHGTSDAGWSAHDSLSFWTSNVAISSDLHNWIKYPGNPIVPGDHSSPILVPDGNKYRLYTMHNEVWCYLPK